jgi:hypothetical protein
MPGLHEGQGVELEMEAEVGQEEAEVGVEEAEEEEGAHPQQRRQLVVDLVDLVSTSEQLSCTTLPPPTCFIELQSSPGAALPALLT